MNWSGLPAGASTQSDFMYIGGRLFTNLSSLIILHGRIQNTVATTCTLRTANGSSGYTPSGSNKFRARAIRMSIAGVSSGASCTLMYSNNDVGFAGTTAYVSPVYYCGTTNAEYAQCPGSPAQGYYETVTDFLVPNGKYPGLYDNGAANQWIVQIFGYEEA